MNRLILLKNHSAATKIMYGQKMAKALFMCVKRNPAPPMLLQPIPIYMNIIWNQKQPKI